MDKKNSLKEELLNQMDKNQSGSPDGDQKSVQAILAKDAVRIRRLKRATVISWVLLAASFLATGIIGILTGFREEVWLIIPIIGVQALLILAVSCTFILSIRSRTLRMKQIQATLSDIQERLNKLSEDR
jgi:hypothetical protein